MRTLLALGDSPWPARSGGDLRNVAIHEALAVLGDVTVVLFPTRLADSASLPAGTQVHPIPATGTLAGAAARLRALLLRRHHFTQQAVGAGAAATLLHEIARTRPDLVVLAFPLFGPIPADLRSAAPRLVADLSELRAPLARRRLRTARGLKARVQAAIDLATAAPNEAGAIACADAVWVSTEAEAAALAPRRPRSLAVIANAIDVDAYARYRSSGPARRAVAYVGAFDYEPNETAARWLIERVAPALAQWGREAELVLIGRSPTAALRRQAAAAGVELRADVPDAVGELAEVGLLAVTLQSGGGTRLKILEAWAAGVPVVSTSVGIEGLEHKDGEDVLLADDPATMAAAIARVWEDPGLRDALVRNGLARVTARYGLARTRDEVRAAVASVAR